MIVAKISKIPFLLGLHIKLKLHGVTYGKKVRGNRPVIKNRGEIRIGDRVSLNSYPDGELCRTGLQCHLRDSRITIGDDCSLNGVMIHCRTAVTIGNFCMFGPGSKIVDNDSHRVDTDIEGRRKPPNSSPIVIEDNVWVGMNSLVLKGVHIGRNSVVAAHAVVTKDVPENVLVAGNPATIIKRL